MHSLIDYNKKKDIKITYSKEDTCYTMEVSDYAPILEYMDITETTDEYGISNMISNSILWNSGLQMVNKGKYHVINNGNKVYNILTTDDELEVDERTLLPNNTVIEKIMHYDSFTDEIVLIKEKHDEKGSTHDIRKYELDDLIETGNIYKIYEAYAEIGELLKGLTIIKGINNIIDIDSTMSSLLNNQKIKKLQMNAS